MSVANIRIAHVNIRSLCPKVNEIKSLIEHEKINVLGVTETWLSNFIDDDAVSVPGYDFFRVDRGSRGGGVGAYVQSSLKASKLVLDQSVSQITSELECIWLSVIISGMKIVFGILYRPPNYNNLQASITMIERAMDDIRSKCDEVFLLGDFNINLLKQSNVRERLNDLFETYSFSQIVTKPTRKNSLLDIIVTSNTDLVHSEVIHIDMHNISDHQLTMCELSLQHQRQPYEIKTFRDFRSFNLDAFQADLQTFDWRYLYAVGNVDDKVNILNSNLLQLFDIHAPLITRKISKPKAEWYTECIRKMVKERNARLTKYKRTKRESDWVAYTEMRNLVTDSIRREKREYLKNRME
ncbi:unnamed protein product [Callosobruchus maculatus]|uniref:Endonuclease/exonuclease/phosphatase domain-containing protein n=1 Tax=Callosobruchus maculatus TaxID=64391 RepID=A0A653CPL9_CALMS|nr:unnamed protein product [Callosobruchus maculatus]